MDPDPIEAVVFDFDGVLVRSIELHAVAYRSVLAPLDVRVTLEDVLLREGARSETIIREMTERAGLALEAEQVRHLADLKQRVFGRFGAPKPYEVARDVVAEVAERGFERAIVTGTRRENIHTIAPDIAPFFEHLVTQESYTRDKPHPEPYLTAAEALGIAPENILVVENAPRGVESAKTAGMFVVAVTSTLPAKALREADVVIRDLPEVLDVLPGQPGEPPQR